MRKRVVSVYCALCMMALLTACSGDAFSDKETQDRLDQLEARVEKIEAQMQQNEVEDEQVTETLAVDENEAVEASAEGEQYLMDIIEPYITPNPNWYSTEPVKMGGKVYEHGFSCYGYNGLDARDEACFNLEGKYHELSCVFGIVSPSIHFREVTFTIIADGTVAESLTLPHDALPETITVSVEGCKQLRLVVEDESSPYPRESGVYGVMEIVIK